MQPRPHSRRAGPYLKKEEPPMKTKTNLDLAAACLDVAKNFRSL